MMPSYLLKAAPDDDFYVEWSSVADGPTWCGSRREALHHFDAELVQRADENGSSAADPDTWYGWRTSGMVVSGRWWLPRCNLAAFGHHAAASIEDTDLRLQALLEDPTEDPAEENPTCAKLVRTSVVAVD
ncbi:hypothetical protein [Actinomadura rudentiformis]|uniref:Uncharacterized protein n=1 Tax=Actinomadura rudentiformis TaxID=359158 RepID=A0A6H9YFP8_9ACTN|nr:hypothetical protein [Actinomadura rudentiformis]KAB2344860.1 hypothetical protein F8566_30170 [Actinomadura rudentiformis]